MYYLQCIFDVSFRKRGVASYALLTVFTRYLLAPLSLGNWTPHPELQKSNESYQEKYMQITEMMRTICKDIM